VTFNISVVWLLAYLILAERQNPDSSAETTKSILSGVARTRELVISKNPNLAHIDTSVRHYCTLVAAFYGPVVPSVNWDNYAKNLLYHLEHSPQDHTQFHNITRAACLKIHAEISRIEDPSKVPVDLLTDIITRINSCMLRSHVELDEFVKQALWGPNPYIPSQNHRGKTKIELYEPVESR
jgi:hypothetical protein